MRYTITEMTDYASWCMTNVTIISEPGSDEIVALNSTMGNFLKFYIIIEYMKIYNHIHIAFNHQPLI